MTEDNALGDRRDRAAWLYLSEIKDKAELSLSGQTAIMDRLNNLAESKEERNRSLSAQMITIKLLREIRLYLQLIIGLAGAAGLMYFVLPRV